MKRSIWTIFIFAAILAMLIVVEARPAFPDPDSFYHAKMALMIRDQGFIHEFPWLQATVLRDAYVDHHLLYHILLIPFVTLFDPLVGMKVSAAVFALAAFYLLYRLLKSIGAPAPAWFTLASALSINFLHRMSLPRAPSLSLLVLMLGIWAMLRGRPWLTFIIAFAFVWLYNGWPLLLVAYGCVVFGEIVARRLTPDRDYLPLIKTGFLLLLGLTAGLVINPYYPANMQFDLLHIFKIGVVNYAPDIRVGQEWSSVSIVYLIQQNLPAFFVFALSAVLLFPAAAVKPITITASRARICFTFIFLAAGFVLMTLKSHRYVEYAVPFLILTAGGLAHLSAPFVKQEVWPMLKAWMRASMIRSVALALFVGFAVGVWSVQEVQTVIGDGDYFYASQYQGATDWMRAHVPPQQTIFTNTWDSTMIYFYLDDTHYYLVGLDPRFMYDHDPALYQTWYGLVSGHDADVSQVVSEFGTRVVVIDKRIGNNFEQNVKASGLFVEAFSDEWTAVYTTL